MEPRQSWFLQVLLLTFVYFQECNSFMVASLVHPTTRGSLLFASFELEPEPEGGEELIPRNSMPGARVKNMGEAQGCKSDDGTPYSIWMTAEVEGALVKEIRTQILKDASKKANFPGFRKGQVPPYAQPQITLFSVQEAIIKTVQGVMDAYGLAAISGSDGEMNVHEDVEDICKSYKVGDNIQFTASINAAFESSDEDGSGKDTESSIIDAEVQVED